MSPTPDRRTLVGHVLGAFVASRLLLLAIVGAIDTVGTPWSRDTYDVRPVLGALTGHDAVYYLGIAAEGYHRLPVSEAYPDWVFFPAYPAVVRVASLATLGDVALAGVLVANLALLAGMAVIARIMVEQGDGRAVPFAMWFLVFAPGALAFGMAYSDSLLLAASAGAILAARHRLTWLVAVLFAVATLARPPGILLGLPLMVAVWQADRGPSWRLLALAGGPIALLGFAAYQGAVLGDPLAFIHGQAAWNLPTLLGDAGDASVGAGAGWYIPLLGGLLLAALLVYTAMIPGLIRSRIPRPEVVWALVAFASVFVSGRLQSDARYLAAAWPFAWFLALRRRRVRQLVLGLSVAAYLIFGVLSLTQLMAP